LRTSRPVVFHSSGNGRSAFFQPDAYISIDYDQRRAQIFTNRLPALAGWTFGPRTVEIKEGDALADEIDSFLECVRSPQTSVGRAARKGCARWKSHR
jgi:hypothetical protein